MATLLKFGQKTPLIPRRYPTEHFIHKARLQALVAEMNRRQDLLKLYSILWSAIAEADATTKATEVR